MDEVWKDIKGYEGYYQVSSTGKVRSLDRIDCNGRKREGRILVTCCNKKRNNSCGKVKLSKDGIYRYHYVNRLVWLTFNNKDLDEEIYIYHDNENINNKIDNLQNAISKQELGVKNIANNYSHAVKCITENKKFNSVSEASRYYNIDRQCIYTCCKGRQKTAGKLKDGTRLIWEYIN